MDKLIEKIGSYNLFNNLFPGAIYCFMTNELIGLNLCTDDIIENLFIYYFAGMIIGRIGSITIEPICKKVKFVIYAPYKDFLKASIKDKKLKILLEVNNTYRTMMTLGLVILVTELYYKMYQKFICVRNINFVIIGVLMIIIFTFSFRKQTRFIKERVECDLK